MEARIQELEIRYTLQQDLLLQLNDVIAQHTQELARLRAEVDELRAKKGSEPLPFDANERPPHY
jgi:uncharacterized coiled-coil protein SlyX